jgi:predicted RNA-binding Zn-ribbon protein involved in translation (DUF1610 family)
MPIQVTCHSCQRSFNAPDAAAGKRAKCPQCGGAIDIPAPPAPEEVLDAEPEPVLPFTDEDFEVEPPAALPPTDNRKSCPMCGEMIQKNAIKCRHCGEIFDPLLKAQLKKGSGAVYDSDSDLSIGDWVLAIVCSSIGCLMGIVYMTQGKPKGKKMLLVSIIMQFVWGAVRVAIQSANQQ